MRKLIISIPIFLFSGFLVLNIISILISSVFLFPKVYSRMEIEAGCEVPEIEAFLRSGKLSGAFLTDISKIDTHSPGKTTVKISVEGKEYESVLNVVDTIAPTARPVQCYAAEGCYIKAGEFAADIADATGVTVEYKTAPDFSQRGWQDVVIILTDEGGNSTEIESSAYIYDIAEYIEIEAGSSPDAISPKDFIINYIEADPPEVEFDTDLNALDFKKPCVYDIGILIGGRETRSKINIIDTTPPKCTVMPLKCALNNHMPADKFVADIIDATHVTVSYKKTPDFSAECVQSVAIILTDEYGNSVTEYTVLTVMEDTEPPAIDGEIDKFAKVGSNVLYRSGITVNDNCDDTVPLEVDSSAVNLQKQGIYPVIYTATDFSGNSTSVKGSLTVMEADMDEVLEMADEILAQIITEDMTPEQKVRAVYNWIVFHVSYKNVEEKNSLVVGGYNAFKLHRGDCYTYYAAAEILLTKLDIENIPITRLENYNSRHFWSLVNLGDGWYHFDACPRSVYFDGCMFTETQALEFCRIYGKYYYDYDRALYPEVVK